MDTGAFEGDYRFAHFLHKSKYLSTLILALKFQVSNLTKLTLDHDKYHGRIVKVCTIDKEKSINITIFVHYFS